MGAQEGDGKKQDNQTADYEKQAPLAPGSCRRGRGGRVGRSMARRLGPVRARLISHLFSSSITQTKGEHMRLLEFETYVI
ncbi:hypothetical protein AA0311_0180 [Asaia bogorensis NBRC 16594]|uniref:Uncharacterized protein n=1 Tax=Asaia bogorensis NBRC 16594 TaxID=1231624 RepID=A0AAN4R2I4_9PROT|nr:hypothetical protein AA0311_0180 [Asaia bogorensis NBRC 16594]GEL53415.1 hypothetical protein ABO01nite_14220 [Asaia bogorensis NBRC 16594]